MLQVVYVSDLHLTLPSNIPTKATPVTLFRLLLSSFLVIILARVFTPQPPCVNPLRRYFEYIVLVPREVQALRLPQTR